MVDVDDSFPRNNKRTVRDRASESLDTLRTALDSPVRSPPPARDSYLQAVSRLKVLLQQYNDHQGIHHASPPPSHVAAAAIPGHLPDADELKELINHYYSVIQHQQAQVDLLKDALVNLKQKTKLLCEENQSLLEQLKESTVNQLLNHHKEKQDQRTRDSRNISDYSDTEENINKARSSNPRKCFSVYDQEWLGMDDSPRTSKNTRDIDEQLFLSPKERKFVMKMEEEVDKIRCLHEAKTKQLESLLFTARDEIEEQQRQIAKLEEKLREKDMIHIAEHPGQPVLCVKCGQQEALLSSTHGDALTQTLEKLKRERDDLMETLTNQNSSIAKTRQREIDAYNQVKKSCELAEQAQLEKAEAIIQIQQLKQEVQQQKERYDKFVASAKERAEKENEKLMSEYQKQIEALKNKIQSANDERAAAENQVERLTREKVGLLSELEQSKAQIIANSTDVSKVSQDTLRDLTEKQVKHSLAMQEISSLKTALQTSNRQRDQERTRLTTEMDELRRRLDEAERGWMDSKEDCVKLTEKLNATEREVKMAVAVRTSLEKARDNDMNAMKQESRQRDQTMSVYLQETEKKHSQVRIELEHMLESQLQITDRLKEECKKLSQQLEDTSKQSRADMRDAEQENSKQKSEVSNLTSKCNALEHQVRQKEKRLNKQNKKIAVLEKNTQKYAQQIYELLLKQNSLMKDRQALSREVEYWRQQTLQSQKQDGVMRDIDVESNASITDKTE